MKPASADTLSLPWALLARYAGALCASSNIERVESLYLRWIRSLIPASAYGIYLLDPYTLQPFTSAARGAPQEFLSHYEQLGRANDPFFQHMRTTQHPVHERMLFRNVHQWGRHFLYREMLAAHGLEHTMQAPLLVGDRVIGTLNFARSAQESAFGPHDIRIARLVMQFTAQAIDYALTYKRLQERCLAAEWAVCGSSVPLVICDEQGTISVMSDEAARRLEVDGNAGELQDTLRTNALMLRAPGGEARHGRIQRRSGTTEVCSIRVPGTDVMVVSYLIDNERLQPDFAALRALLTPKEVEILQLVASGMHDADIAHALVITIHTVKQHLKSIYRKLDVCSRTDAVRYAFEARR